MNLYTRTIVAHFQKLLIGALHASTLHSWHRGRVSIGRPEYRSAQSPNYDHHGKGRSHLRRADQTRGAATYCRAYFKRLSGYWYCPPGAAKIERAVGTAPGRGGISAD